MKNGNEMGLKQDYLYCEEIIRKNSKSFYKAFSYLPEDKAGDIYAIYAFCRIADDITDIQNNKTELEIFKNKWIDFKSGITPNEPVWRALRNTFKKYEMNYEAFDHMIQGQFSDFDFVQPQTQELLEQYCYYVAGTVGLMILPVLSRRHRELEESGIILGKAMQITNILRDIGEDFEKGRVYLPVSVMNKFNVTTDDIREKKADKNFYLMWEYEAKLAEAYYLKVTDDFHLYDKDSLLPVMLSVNLYKEILNEIRRNGYDCLTKRNYTGKVRKILIYLKTLNEKKNFKIQK